MSVVGGLSWYHPHLERRLAVCRHPALSGEEEAAEELPVGGSSIPGPAGPVL